MPASLNPQGRAQPEVVWKKKNGMARTTVVRVLHDVSVLILYRLRQAYVECILSE